MYQVSLPSTLSFGSLRSEEVVIEKSAQGYFLLMIVMEMLIYKRVPSFTFMLCMVSKSEK